MINNKYTRKVCPMCDAKGKDLKEEFDKTKPLYRLDTGLFMYPKITICKKCGYEF